MDSSRRSIVRLIATLPAWLPVTKLFADSHAAISSEAIPGNFRFIYGNAEYRRDFFDFLVNVFHLYPEDELHERLLSGSEEHEADRDTYQAVQSQLDDVKPFLGDLTYALPALSKQKKEMADQASALLDTDRRYEGYLEIGSTGRYIDALEEKLEIVGDRFMSADIVPTNSIIDILDRGQFSKAGAFIPMNDYQTAYADNIPANSLDLVTVFIGFHHCPMDLRGDFFEGIRAAMKPGASLILRDHDARDEKMRRIVALAHDVFNMGTRETWKFNEAELRNFYSLAKLDEMMRNAGFVSDGKRLFQHGDPTLNALMLYRKA